MLLFAAKRQRTAGSMEDRKQVPDHRTALHRAAMMGNSQTTAALIQGGCAVDLQDRDGNTALHEASWHGFSSCVKLLVEAGADVHTRNKAGNTALHLASQNAHAQAARLLLLGGATPDTKNNVGDTCLHVAARYNNLSLVKILLSSRSSVTERNQRGDTALHVAAALNHKKTVELLLEAGTDGTIRNDAGKTALDKARDNSHRDVALVLARAPQVHCYMRGRTLRKRRGLKDRCRTQSIPRAGLQANKQDHRSPSSHQSESKGHKLGLPLLQQRRRHGHQQHQHHHCHHADTPTASSSPCSNHRRLKEQCFPIKRETFCVDGSPTKEGNTYHLYTLYRDREGFIRQAPAGSCHCKHLMKKLEGEVKATQEEMRLHVLNVQQQVNSRLGRMERRNRHQIKVLDLLNQKRTAAERKKMMYRIEQVAARGRDEAMMTQAAVDRHLKRWCMTHVSIPAEAQYYKLVPSPSVEQSVVDVELESLPLLSVVSGDSSASLATYVNILSSRSQTELEQRGGRRLGRSPDDYENTALFPLPARPTSRVLLGSTDPCRQTPGATVSLCGKDLSSSSSSSSSSCSSTCDQGPSRVQHQGPDRPNSKRAEDLLRVRKHTQIVTDDDCTRTRTLEFFIDRPTEPTFSQERNNLHAMEVTQRFFETVSGKLEHWYERKIVEVEQQTALRLQQDRKQLLQHISMLEEELQRLKTNQNTES